MRGFRANMLPIGIEIKPTGEQLIEAYLLPWAKGEKLEWNGIVEKQMYGENFPCEPWKVFSDIESSYHSKMEEKGAIKYTIHAFTMLLRPSNSKRVSRRAGKGRWAGQTGPKKIKNSETGCVIGQSKMFVYDPSGEADVGHWTMHEYCLSGESVKKSGRSNAADFVVCKITKAVKKAEANEFMSPANEVPFSILEPYYGGYEHQVVQQEMMSYPSISDGSLASIVLPYNSGYEAQVPVPASPTVSMKRVAEVDLLRNGEDLEGVDLKRQKCDGKEYSDASPDWMKELEMLLSPANEVSFANPGVVPIFEPYYGGNEAPVPVPIPASPTVSTKRAAEVDLRNEEDSESDCFKIQKCKGNEFSDALDELKKLEDMFASKFSNQFSPF